MIDLDKLFEGLQEQQEQKKDKGDYGNYLNSPEWEKKRNAAIALANGECKVCKRDWGLHVHHQTYERFGRELPMDLLVLCRECHEDIHELIRENTIAQNKRALAKLREAWEKKSKGN